MTHPAWVNEYEAFVAEIMERHQIPGAAVAVARDGVIEYERGFGHRDVERGLVVTPDTIFGVGSITKSFTALSIMQLMEHEQLAPSDPVVEYLPEFTVPCKEYTEQITIHHLLTHTTGLPPLPSRYYAQYRDIMSDPNRDRISLPYDVSDFYPIDTFEDLARLVSELDFRLLGAPGEYFSYSNEGYAFLGAIIERVSGQQYASYVKEHILEPAGMDRTAFSLDTVDKLGEVTQLYSSVVEDAEKVVFATPGWWEKHAMYSCGHLKSTVRDLIRYINLYRERGMVNGTRVASPDSIEAMTQPYARQLGDRGSFYAYGLAVNPDFHGTRSISHGGGDKGVSAQLSLLVDRGVSVAVLTNLSGVPSGVIARGALNAALGLPAETPAREYKPQQVPVETLKRFVGVYRSGEGAELEFSVDEGTLWIRLAGQSLEATPLGNNCFVARPTPDTEAVYRFLERDGDVWAVTAGSRIVTRADD